jgi:predicted DNA-binding transcriptional regulator
MQLQQQLTQSQSIYNLQSPPQPPQMLSKDNEEIILLKNKIENLEKQLKDQSTNKKEVIEINMSKPKSEPEL